jgi:hypothetical protein
MAEHLFSELSASQGRVAALTAELEQLREFQGQLAEAATAEAETCRGNVQVGGGSCAAGSSLGQWACGDIECWAGRGHVCCTSWCEGYLYG